MDKNMKKKKANKNCTCAIIFVNGRVIFNLYESVNGYYIF